jgi:hypothetical protein
MKKHCWCNMLNARKGRLIAESDIRIERDTLPMCSEQCAASYDRLKEERQLRLDLNAP